MPQNVSDATQNVINVKIDGQIAYIVLNRPEKRNAINNEVLHALPKALEEIERHALIEALKMSKWVQKDAAELLSISPRVMNYKIKTLGIEFPRGRRAAALATPVAAAS